MSEGNGYFGRKSNHIPRIGEKIYFGTKNGKKIEWKVLDVQDNKAFLVCESIICNMPYHNSGGFTTWEDCLLRKWLNETFLHEYFSLSERSCILNCNVVTEADSDFEIQKTVATVDRIFLLSIKDAERLLLFLPKSEELDEDELDDYELLVKNSWWLRTAGPSCFASCVDYFGDIELVGDFVEKNLGVRPVLWFDSDPGHSVDARSFKHELKVEPNKVLADIDEKIAKLEAEIARLSAGEQ